MNVLGLALASTLLVSSDLTCRGSIEEWSKFLTDFNESLYTQGRSAAGYDYWFFFSDNPDDSNTWTVVVHNLLAPGSYCTGLNMFGKLIDPSDHLTGEVL